MSGSNKTLQVHFAYCGWCENRFTISNGGQLGAFRLGRNVYCSKSCLSAMNNSKEEYKKIRGPCPTCGKMFRSRVKKIYCAMACYMSSPVFADLQETLRNSNAKLKADRIEKQNPCPNCGNEVIKGRKYCGKMCRREFFSDRFDRWVANPEQIALPQCYDEFLDSFVLSCLVDGCHWRGKLLSTHCNYAHGITAEVLKKMAGFNRSTGLVSKDVFMKMSESKKQAFADGRIGKGFADWRIGKGFVPSCGPGNKEPKRLEGKEHAKKARALMMIGGSRRSPEKCRNCGIDVLQPVCGKKMYCSHRCRSAYYESVHSAELICGNCGAAFMGSISQVKRVRNNLNVYCTTHCRGIANSNSRRFGN